MDCGTPFAQHRCSMSARRNFMNVRGEFPVTPVPVAISSSEREIMAFDPGLCEEVMRELNNLPGILGLIMVSADGELMGSRLTERFRQESLGATGTDMMDMLERVLSQYRLGHPKALMIEGEEGRIAVVNAGPNVGYLVIGGTRELNVGLAEIVLEDLVGRFR
jgi:predicted regulator of Ras-like GTPase activity (Roadblock/LC7/MglB family)